jgi:hypothetical protein
VAAGWKKQRPMKKRMVTEVERSLEKKRFSLVLLSLTGRHAYRVRLSTPEPPMGIHPPCHAQDGGAWRYPRKMPALQEKVIGSRSVRVRAKLGKAEFQAFSFGGGSWGVGGVVKVPHVARGKTSD